MTKRAMAYRRLGDDGPEVSAICLGTMTFGQPYTKPGAAPAVVAYAGLAASRGTSLTERALAFVYSRPFVTSTTIGATTMDPLENDLAAWDRLPGAELLAAIDEIHLRHGNRAP